MKTWQTKSGYKIIRVLTGGGYVFLLTNGIKNILIDTSLERSWKKLDKRLQSLKINYIDFVILTHTHYDHGANVFLLKNKYGAKILVHRDEAEFIINGLNKFPNGTNALTRFFIKNMANKFAARFNFPPCNCDILINTKFELNEFGFDAYILPTPGHSIGSISIIIDNEIALTGDALLRVFKWFVLPPFADDVKQMICSWKTLLDTGCTLFIPAHGTAIPKALLQKHFDKRQTELGKK